MSWRPVIRLLDVNVLVYAHREDAEGHPRFRDWLRRVVDGDEPFGVPSLVFSGFLRVVTHPRIFTVPSPLPRALAFVEVVRRSPPFLSVEPGPRHWTIFRKLCEEADAKGNLIADAYFAAIAIESGCEWITTDRDYARFPGLRIRHPLKVR